MHLPLLCISLQKYGIPTFIWQIYRLLINNTDCVFKINPHWFISYKTSFHSYTLCLLWLGWMNAHAHTESHPCIVHTRLAGQHHGVGLRVQWPSRMIRVVTFLRLIPGRPIMLHWLQILLYINNNNAECSNLLYLISIIHATSPINFPHLDRQICSFPQIPTIRESQRVSRCWAFFHVCVYLFPIVLR